MLLPADPSSKVISISVLPFVICRVVDELAHDGLEPLVGDREGSGVRVVLVAGRDERISGGDRRYGVWVKRHVIGLAGREVGVVGRDRVVNDVGRRIVGSTV